MRRTSSSFVPMGEMPLRARSFFRSLVFIVFTRVAAAVLRQCGLHPAPPWHEAVQNALALAHPQVLHAPFAQPHTMAHLEMKGKFNLNSNCFFTKIELFFTQVVAGLMIAVLSAVTPSLTPALPRYPIDFPPYDIVLLRGATEPFFVAANVSTCTLNREKGYSLNAPGFTHGDPGHNAVSVNASFINASAIACHVVDSIITAGNTTVVLDAGGTACETALGALCPASKAARGAACWNCTHVPATKALLKAAGCAKGDFKAYCGPQSVANAAPYDVVAGELQRAETLGSKVCASGPYACAYIEHFAAIAPAFGRRPYFGETEGAVVVKSDYSFEGETLTLRVRVSGTDIFGRNGTKFAGGRSVRLPFDLTVLPPLVSERVDITVTRADGRVAAKPKRFLRAPPPEGPTQPGITIQVDHESIGGGGMLIGGVPHVSNGWFGAGLDFMSAGLPQPDACAAPRTNGNTNAVNSAGSASIVSEMGKRGLTFVRAGTAGITLWHASSE